MTQKQREAFALEWNRVWWRAPVSVEAKGFALVLMVHAVDHGAPGLPLRCSVEGLSRDLIGGLLTELEDAGMIHIAHDTLTLLGVSP